MGVGTSECFNEDVHQSERALVNVNVSVHHELQRQGVVFQAMEASRSHSLV